MCLFESGYGSETSANNLRPLVTLQCFKISQMASVDGLDLGNTNSQKQHLNFNLHYNYLGMILPRSTESDDK